MIGGSFVLDDARRARVLSGRLALVGDAFRLFKLVAQVAGGAVAVGRSQRLDDAGFTGRPHGARFALEFAALLFCGWREGVQPQTLLVRESFAEVFAMQ